MGIWSKVFSAIKNVFAGKGDNSSTSVDITQEGSKDKHIAKDNSCVIDQSKNETNNNSQIIETQNNYYGNNGDKMPSVCDNSIKNDDKEENLTAGDYTIGDYIDISKMGITYQELLDRLIQIDYKTMEGLNERLEGNTKQWAELFEKHPETWKVLLYHGEIIGYWHFLALNDGAFNEAKQGNLFDGEITIDKTKYMLCPDTYKCYITAISILPKHRTHTNFKLLIDAWIKQIIKFAEDGIFIKEWCTHAFTSIGNSLCDSLKMKLLVDHQQSVGHIYGLKFIPLCQNRFLKRYPRLYELYATCA